MRECLKMSPLTLLRVCSFHLKNPLQFSSLCLCCMLLFISCLFTHLLFHLLFLFLSSWWNLSPFTGFTAKHWVTPSLSFCSPFQGMMQPFPVLSSKLLTASVSFITQFTRGALRSFKDARMRKTVSDSKYLTNLWDFRFSVLLVQSNNK